MEHITEGRLDSLYCPVDIPELERALHVCQICGFWTVLNSKGLLDVPTEEVFPGRHQGGYERPLGEYEASVEIDGMYGTLKDFSIEDIVVPCDELKRYLMGRYNDRMKIHPKKMEEIVESIFKSAGMTTRATSYSKDGGIDIFVLEHPGDKLVGVQVKRTKNKIECAAIDTFQGALIRNDVTKGIFVTTSDYTGGAKNYAREFNKKAIPIELWNSKELFDRIRISLRPAYSEVDESTPFYRIWNELDTVKTFPLSQLTMDGETYTSDE